jgi:ribonuclease P protein component
MRRRDRLRASTEIETVRRQGRRVPHALALLLYRPNDRPRSRFCFIAGRRVGKAVHRNRAKRLLREAVRQHLSYIPGGWDCVLIAKAATANARFADVEAAVLHLLGQAQLFDRVAFDARDRGASTLQGTSS